MKAGPCTLPSDSRLPDLLPGYTYLDSFAVAESRPELPITTVYVGALGHLPRWFKHLLVLRTRLVAPFGLKGPTSEDLRGTEELRPSYAIGDTIVRWTIFDLRPHEIIAGMDNKHLDFRVSLMRDRVSSPPSIVLSTAVKTHNDFGKIYLSAIKPFHRFGVATLLSNAAAASRL